MNILDLYKNCLLCPRSCRADRTAGPGRGRSGICRQGDRPKISYIGPHPGEEPPISGRNGSGTVFFTGCSLRCSYCQNYQISHHDLGKTMDLHDLSEGIVKLIKTNRVHNINFVTPDHFLPHVLMLVASLRGKGFRLPVVFNLSGYQSPSSLKMSEQYADIYLVDYKYAEAGLALRLSTCRDYPRTALEAIAEMVKQKGFLAVDNNQDPAVAHKGVLVRHLILPGFIENSIQALTTLFLEFGRGLPLSLMSQYWPVLHQREPSLNRFVTALEFERVYNHALELGFENMFVQFPEENHASGAQASRFLPDFNLKAPFGGKAEKQGD